MQDEEYYHFHLLGVQAHERPLDISVPVKQWEKLPFPENPACCRWKNFQRQR